MSKTAEYKGFQIYREGRKWYIPLVGYASEKAPTLKKAYEKIDKLTEVQSWNDDIQDTEPVSIDFDTRVRLGCAGDPETTIEAWMALQEIDDLLNMVDYIDGLDYNIQVI
jgi:hypothetical protein